MNLQQIGRDIDRLSVSDALLADAYIRDSGKRACLYGLAGLAGIAGIAPIEYAAYLQLQAPIGQVWAAAAIYVVNAALAVMLAAVATFQPPKRDFDAQATLMDEFTMPALLQRGGRGYA